MEQTAFYLILGGILFAIGSAGVLVRRNAIVIFMCIELMLNAVNLTFVALSQRFHAVDGQVYVFFVMAIAAAEAAVGLAIILAVFRNNLSIKADDALILHG